MGPVTPAGAAALYLARLDRGLWGVPRARREEILEAVGEFLEEDLACGERGGLPPYGWLIQTHGQPEVMARQFRFAEWLDRGTGWLAVLAPVAGALAWLVFLGLLLGLERGNPGYLTFLADFPVLILAAAATGRFRRNLPGPARVGAAVACGFATGFIYCSNVCGGAGLGVFEHALYGAYLGLLLEHAALRPGLGWRVGEALLFLAGLQVLEVLHRGRMAWMNLDCMAYHIVNALAMALVVGVSARMVKAVGRMTLVLAPEGADIS
ncbi:MAG TPA: hypothetical protein VK188_07520 [Holophaga sp.]|nr:hypothetical protein [Holophaga sp.]